jgi:hypothetical protein
VGSKLHEARAHRIKAIEGMVVSTGESNRLKLSPEMMHGKAMAAVFD